MHHRIPQMPPPFLQASIGQNRGGADKCHIGGTFSGGLMGKTREKQQSKANMAQIASMQAISTVFIG